MKKNENAFLNLLINIVIPTVILVKFSSSEYLGSVAGLIIALAFPIGYGVYDFYKTRDYNFFSILGIASIFLTGGIGLLQLDPKWVAIKEAGVPLLIALVLLLFRSKFPLVKKLLHEIIDSEKVYQRLHEKNQIGPYEKRLEKGNYLIVASFLLSSVLNFTLAKILVQSPPGTEAFNAELGKLTALSYPVIALPSMIVMFFALFYVITGITRFTELEMTEVFKK